MSPLTDQELATLVELLDEHERTLASVVHEHFIQLRDSSAPDAIAPAGDTADLAEIELVRDKENAAVGRDVRALRDIEAAMERLAGDEAGNCIDCGGEIGFERLRVQPTALRCVHCQALYEQTYPSMPTAPTEQNG